jgi:hypothetical protein
MPESSPSTPKLMLVGMRRLLALASLLVLIIGLRLMIFSEETEVYFPWTISVPLTAAFMGAAYFAACFVEFLAARDRHWSNGRIAVPAVLLFTVLTLIVTLVHLDKFHLGDKFLPVTQVITWFWLFIYISVPIAMGVLLFLQVRAKGGDLPRRHPLPPALRGMFAIYTLIMIPLGIGMLLAPDTFNAAWPWTLTPLTARIVGAWLIGLGTLTGHTVLENDWVRVLPAMPTLGVGAALELLMLARYSSLVNGTTLSVLIYVVTLGSMVPVGIYGTWRAFQLRRQTSP